MSTKTSSFTPLRIKLAAGFALALVLSACSSTDNSLAEPIVDARCLQDANTMRGHAESTASSAQLLASAKTMQHCIAYPLPLNMHDDEQRQVMQVMANITLTYLKAGDIESAKVQLNAFENQFTGQDLYLPDYTSFIDTATALLNSSGLSTQQLASLNISRELRQELERQQYWLAH